MPDVQIIFFQANRLKRPNLDYLAFKKGNHESEIKPVSLNVHQREYFKKNEWNFKQRLKNENKAELRQSLSACVYCMRLYFQSNFLCLAQNQRNYFENATACSKRTLKTTVATQLYFNYETILLILIPINSCLQCLPSLMSY